jgi:AcrR family transcriptional regulator
MAPASAPTQNARARQTREQNRARIVAAATELVRERSFPELSVGEIMEAAGFERTIFYRHFDDLGDLLMQASREAIEALYETELDLGTARDGPGPEAVRAAIGSAVIVYRRHGPLLRALAEAAAGDEQIAAGQAALRRRFDELVARSLGEFPQVAANPPADIHETARALNLMNESYLLDAFGREPRVSVEAAVRALTEIWVAVIDGRRRDAPRAAHW